MALMSLVIFGRSSYKQNGVITQSVRESHSFHCMCKHRKRGGLGPGGGGGGGGGGGITASQLDDMPL